MGRTTTLLSQCHPWRTLALLDRLRARASPYPVVCKVQTSFCLGIRIPSGAYWRTIRSADAQRSRPIHPNRRGRRNGTAGTSRNLCGTPPLHGIGSSRATISQSCPRRRNALPRTSMYRSTPPRKCGGRYRELTSSIRGMDSLVNTNALPRRESERPHGRDRHREVVNDRRHSSPQRQRPHSLCIEGNDNGVARLHRARVAAEPPAAATAFDTAVRAHDVDPLVVRFLC